jgi:hypothetical protein
LLDCPAFAPGEARLKSESEVSALSSTMASARQPWLLLSVALTHARASDADAGGVQVLNVQEMQQLLATHDKVYGH